MVAQTIHKMCSFSIAFFLVSTLTWSSVECSAGLFAESSSFCYDDADPHCPDPNHWGGYCNGGSQQQSPILLPSSYTPSPIPRAIDLYLDNYFGYSFTMINNGHTLAVQLPKNANTNMDPISLDRVEGFDYTQYRLDSAHFHWGREDNAGSEHCFAGQGCYSMELHLVHYRTSYDSVSSAINSADPNTLVVIAIMFNATEDKEGEPRDGSLRLAPIIKNLNQVTEPSSRYDVNAHLDFRPFLDEEISAYTYKGSLTMPDCNEKVNWYVLDVPIAISHEDVQAFRSLRDSRKQPMLANNRPLQNRNGRPVYFAAVSS